MGRIKTKHIKAKTQDVFDKYKEELTIEFQKNKEILNRSNSGASKKLRNVVAGYATRLKKKEIRERV